MTKDLSKLSPYGTDKLACKAGECKISNIVEICNIKGLHARAAAAFVKTANGYEAEIMVEKDGHIVDGKSIMGLMMLAASKGTKIEIKADGNQAKDAVDALSELVNAKFHEE